MSATPSTPTPAGDDRNLVAVDPVTALTFEDHLHLFWKKNRNAVFVFCGLVIVAIAGREGWEYMAQQKELEVEKAYAAATTPEQLKSFAAAHSSHTLGGIAQMRMADDAYKAGKSADALTGYDLACTILKEGPLVARAQIGRALAKLQAGKTAEGSGDLRKLVDDANQLKAIRAEGAYHLTSLSVEAGNAADAQKYVEQLMQIDAASQWTQRAMSLRASLPTAPAPATDQKKDEASTGGVQLKIPGK
ncbi:MAG: hypothetical protein EXS37_20975 [Opitutus sp.]|nr:hypothetical protein [Opitutus sp.]